MSNLPFLPARAKLCIASLDKPRLQVRAQYNPRELQIDKQIQWLETKSRNNQSDGRQDRSEQDDVEFKEGPPRTMSIELLFDGYEQGESVEPDVVVLEELSSVQAPEAPARREPQRRPHHCIITWGASRAGMRPFLCVIESLTVKYTMWDHSGTPLRATCTVKVKEAQRMIGSQEPPKEHEEQRRDPRWERRIPPPKRDPDVERYMQELADRRDRVDRAPDRFKPSS